MNPGRIIDLGMIQCCLFTSIIYMQSLKKRDSVLKFWMKVLVLGLAGILLFNIYQQWSIDMSHAQRTDIAGNELLMVILKSQGSLILCVIILAVWFYACCELQFLSALYCSACAYLTQDLAYTVFIFCMPQASHRSFQQIKPETLWLEILIVLICNACFYRFLAKGLFSYINQRRDCMSAFFYMIVILSAGRMLGTASRVMLSDQTVEMFRFLLLYDLILTGSLLISQILIFRDGKTKEKLAVETQLYEQLYNEFRSYQETTETLKHNCHDLKHIIEALKIEPNKAESEKLLDKLEDSITDYDAVRNTGNKTLDALLGRTWGSCKQRKIQWTCLANGSALDFMSSFDLYVLLGNILDNAIESVSKIEEEEERFLSVNIRRVHNLVLINVENYCSVCPEFKNGVPATTKEKKDEHGYGMKSIQAVVEKYNGEFNIDIEDGIFLIQIMLPIPEKP